LDLPGLSKRYNPSKLSARDFDRCREPWALSAVVEWLQSLVDQEQYLKRQPLIDGLVALFTHKVSTMNIADAETLAALVIDGLLTNGTLVEEEEWLVFTDKPLSGVIFQLTGNGCYSTRLHSYKETGRCYSHHCQRTEKKIDLSTQPELGPEEDWTDYYKIRKEDLSKVSPKEVERQNILHEIVQKEESYLRELNVLTSLYRDKLQQANPPLIAPKKLPSFIKEVFGKADRVKTANEDHLLPQMKYRQQLEGPWVVGFSDIFREWIRKAKSAYIEYASNFPNAVYLMRQEMERNVLFRTFLHDCSQDPRSRRLTFEHYMKLPISRLQHLGLLLDTALKKSTKDDDEKRNLQTAIEEIKAVTHECDARVGDGIRKVELSELQYKLKLRPTMQRVELNLDHLGRELVYQGELLRGGSTKFTWLETHAILFDHFFVLAKTISEKSSDGSTKYEQYDVSRLVRKFDSVVTWP
jgi:RhoGEF domain